ncbi:hypothetical protein Tco_0703964 [Tanacetum coccineum]|uniref:Secreted protein n=1 Tax=Tanacetum coccineum TaxID=301880 RepID=A0ABQ4Y1V0_9ASTR
MAAGTAGLTAAAMGLGWVVGLVCNTEEGAFGSVTAVTNIHKKTKTRQKPDKTEHRIGKSMENQSQKRMHLSGPTQPKSCSRNPRSLSCRLSRRRRQVVITESGWKADYQRQRTVSGDPKIVIRASKARMGGNRALETAGTARNFPPLQAELPEEAQ